jgi:putative hydrolase of the HAD superfamily
MSFEAIAFDVDGTLYPASSLYLRSLFLAARNLRLAATFGRMRKELRVLAAAPAYRAAPPADGHAFRSMEACLVADRLGWDRTKTADLISRRLYGEVASLFARVRPYTGLVPALDALKAAGLRLAVLSDLPPETKLEHLGLSGYFEAALCAEDSGFLKPEPEPFLMLASRLGLEPSRILYVGNSPAYDIVGAKAVGMGTALVSPRGRTAAGMRSAPDLIFRDWRELVAHALAGRN